MSYKILLNTQLLLIDEEVYRFHKKINDWILIVDKPNQTNGRNLIRIDEKHFYYHRIKYWLANDDFDIFDKKSEIDHINIDEKDNSLSNLRTCTHKQNTRNRKNYRGKHIKGFSYYPDINKPYKAQIQMDNGKLKAKYFHTEQEARNYYLENRIRF